MLDHPTRQARVAFQLRRDGIQRIEKEIGGELHAHCIQARLRKTTLHSLQPQLTTQVVFVVPKSLAHTEDYPVDNPAPKKPSVKSVWQEADLEQHAPRAQAQKGAQPHPYIEVEAREDHAGQKMRQNSHSELLLLKGKPRIGPEN